MSLITCTLPYGPHAVRVDGQLAPFDHSIKVMNHSPTGFAWGYGGSGPAQTALAILLMFVDVEQAQRLYQKFKFEVVAGWPQEGGEFDVDVLGWIADHSQVTN